MRLYQFNTINEEAPNWVTLSVKSFEDTMASTENPFPCYFAKLGLERGSFRYSYIEIEELSRPIVFKENLIHYLNQYKELEWPSVFVVFLKVNEEKNSLDEHEKIFWNILNYLIEEDEVEWPKAVAKDPNSHKWQFYFQGIPLFINGHSSNYKNRITRSSYSDMMMVIQTMDTLKPVTENVKNSNLVRKDIRNRVNRYDKIPVSNLLGSYPDEGSYEWKQFWLPDENIDKGKCPLGFGK